MPAFLTSWRHRRERLGGWLRTLAWYWIAIVSASLLGLSLFAWVGSEVVEQETRGFDEAVRTWVLAHQIPQVSAVFRVITIVGSANALTWLAVAMAVWLWNSRGRHIAAVVASAPAVASALFVGVKDLVHRIRPPGAVPLHLVSYSFPSGHATASTAVLITLSYLLAREGLLSHRAALLIGWLGPLLVGLSRIYLDVHWTTDVLGGWGLGLVVAGLSASAYEHLRARIARASLHPTL
ncbi:MAG TPA: phosphatase PAP2 family protein [Gemmatimonadales bacterium]|nr:phosphatase PAP2 family protein [Gemmatimonadales bacterium]